MAEPRAHAIKRKLFYYDSSDREDSDVMDSDDSVKDKEYVESESSDNLSQDSSDEVRKEKCGLSPLWHNICGLPFDFFFDCYSLQAQN